MATCPKCRVIYPDEQGACPADGEDLLPDQAFAAVDADLTPGERVGEYTVEHKLGEGGFGAVFKAVHPLIGKQVAIKVLHRQFSSSPEMVSRFISEARAVNQIRHRHIIDIFAFGQLADGRHYFVMELLEGNTLDQVFQDRARLPLEEAVPILRSLARALDAAHAKGIAHRDLKPENVFLVQEDDGTVFPKLLDFGIAKLLTTGPPQQHKTRTGAPLGTPDYMSPEQCRGREIDHRTDYYSFGIMTYRVLTGRLPFVGQDFLEVIFKQLGEQPTPPSQVCPDLPPTIDRVVLWLLEKDPAQRPPTLASAVRELEEAAVAAGIAIPVASSTSVSGRQPTPDRLPSSPTPGGVAVRPTPSRLPSPSGAPTGKRGSGLSRGLTPSQLASAETMAAIPTPPVGQPAVVVPAAIGMRRRLGWIVAAGGSIAVAVGLGALLMQSRMQHGAAPPPVVTMAATVPAPPVAPRAAEPRLVPVPSVVSISVSGAPAGAEIVGPDGHILGMAPGPIPVTRSNQPLAIVVRAPGWKPLSTNIVPSVDLTVPVTLEKRAGRPAGVRTKTRDAIEDPFQKKPH